MTSSSSSEAVSAAGVRSASAGVALAPGAERAAGQSGMWARLRLAAGDIKLAHSVFAMPFAVLAAFVARTVDASWGIFAGQLALVVVCMVLARTWAMLVNRLADRAFDAANPRTTRRVIASGRLSAASGRAMASACAAAFVAAASGFWVLFGNFWPTVLSVPVLGWIAFYSYTKRFTWWCHVFLGGALAASPIAAAIAVNPSALQTAPVLWWLSGMVVLWVAGFDIIYALQDVEFDRRSGLYSVPARLGVGRAIWMSRGLHAGAFACLVAAGLSEPRFGVVIWIGVGLVAGLLCLEHVVLARRGQAGLDMAFFTLNGIVSCVLGVAGIVDLVLV
ncbi:MAG: 4-hydroxybenzoate octaprenyltransferase [Phycisphaerales bacterium]